MCVSLCVRRDAVTSLAFREGTHTLFSASCDRTVKLWSLDDRAYMDTLFGHQQEVRAAGGARGRRATTPSTGEEEVACGTRTGRMLRLLACFWCARRWQVLCLDVGRAERAVSCGADRTCRVWKIPEESQLILK